MLKMVLESAVKLGNIFNFKDSLPKIIRSLIIYKFTCGKCNITYIGKTKRHLKLRMCEHLGLSPKTGKEYKYTTQPSTVRRHLHDEKHISNFNNFKIISSAKNDFELHIKESLLIGSLSPELNKQIKSSQLDLF